MENIPEIIIEQPIKLLESRSCISFDKQGRSRAHSSYMDLIGALLSQSQQIAVGHLDTIYEDGKAVNRPLTIKIHISMTEGDL
jgi:hypothetical protein